MAKGGKGARGGDPVGRVGARGGRGGGRGRTAAPPPAGQPELAASARERILHAAELVFAEKGLGGARTREIAARAGANIALIHYYFATKEQLYRAVIEQVFGALAQAVPRAGESGPQEDPVAVVRRFFVAYYEAIGSRPHFPRIMLHELAKGGGTLRGFAREVLAPLYAGMAGFFLDERTRRCFREADFRHALISAIGMNLIYFSARPLIEEVFGPEMYAPGGLVERREAVIDLFLHGIARPRPEGGGAGGRSSKGGRP